ncbi:hypothetical protein POM88_049721 [Heracleum sosnowskyi]|uniref:Uncharacterized protein n=1 Tax=Heracleum sosnowskyi TaxID=360622 RepID=A0AAD8GW48_9APIA|nr:hypothetical protein POM88_049721 [Heracleum sosnowskyi]
MDLQRGTYGVVLISVTIFVLHLCLIPGTSRQIPEVEKGPDGNGIELSRTSVVLKSGTQWFHSLDDINSKHILPAYYNLESYQHKLMAYNSNILQDIQLRDLEQPGEVESLSLEGDVGGGLVLERIISLPKDEPKVVQIDSSIIARSIGAGFGGFSRVVCLRVHPTFSLLHPTESYVSFVSIDGSKHDCWPTSSEQSYEGDLRPNGEWMLVDKCLGVALVNTFIVSQVYKCLIHWGTGTVNLELWSEDRPVSKKSPLTVCHKYEVKLLNKLASARTLGLGGGSRGLIDFLDGSEETPVVVELRIKIDQNDADLNGKIFPGVWRGCAKTFGEHQ